MSMLNAWSTSAYGLYDFDNVRYEHSRNTSDVHSIASITKLFTAYTVVMSHADLDEKVKVQGRAGGRFARGAYLERSELMRAMLMSSDNLAAETLAHAHPGGYDKFIADVNWHLGVNGFKETKIVKKITKTLTEIFKENNVPSIINYMSIDIEGYDLNALESMNLDKYRPELILVEVYAENIVDAPIDQYLRSQGYTFYAKAVLTCIYKNSKI
jgi:hypothetical protein